MKQLALASVAFAAVSAFGAGNTFAIAPSITIVEGQEGVFNDTANWGPTSSGGSVLGAAHGTGNFAITTSVVSANGINVKASYNVVLPTPTGAGYGGTTSANLVYGVQDGARPLGVKFGMPNGASVLWGSTAGAMGLSFSKPIQALGFYVSPAGFAQSDFANAVFTAKIQAFGKTVLHDDLISATYSFAGTVDDGCGSGDEPACTFVTATASVTSNFTGFTSALVTLTSMSGDTTTLFAPVISDLSMEDPSTPMPEPAGLSVLGIGLLGLTALRRRRRSGSPDETARWSPFGRWRVSGMPPDNPSP